jgi:NAD+ kinase
VKKIAVYANASKDPGYTVLSRVAAFSERCGVECVVHEPPEGLPAQFQKASAKSLSECEAAIVIGGDGTMLNAVHEFQPYEIPFLGVNLGTIGFLADVGMDELEGRLASLFSGGFTVEERMMARVEEEGKLVADVLNEATLRHEFGAGVGEFKCYSGNALIGHYSSDGLLVVAPTGSTAYSMSAGGPIVNPACELLIVQPLAPHSLNNRSIIVSSQEELTLEFNAPTTRVYLDGERHRPNGGRLTVKASPRKVRFAKFGDYDFYGLLFEKIKQTNYLRGGLS